MDTIPLIGTIGGASTVIFFLNAFLNKLILKNRFFDSFSKDINDQQLFDDNRFDTQDAMKKEAKRFFSLEEMFKVLSKVAE